MDISAIITLLIGSAVFITGMNMMSSGLKKATGKGLKNLFKKTQNNGVACLGIGAVVTALIQSSAATSVMAIGFIGVGILTIYQAVAIMLGAYIGTTITGVLASFSSFEFSMYFPLLGFIGIVMMFFKKEKVKNIGEILTGLGLLFFGLSTMSSAMKGSVELKAFVGDLFSNISNNTGFFAPILLLIVGALFTALVQSSSATTGVVIVLLTSEAIQIQDGFYLVIGATIGTMITTLIATIGTNVNSRRTTFIALIIKIVAGIVGTILVAIFSKPIADFLISVFKTQELALAMFLVIYSAVFYGISLPLIKPLIKLAEKTIKDKEDEAYKGVLKFIDNHLLDTPTIAMMQAKREIENMILQSFANYKLGYVRLMTGDTSNDKELIEREEQIDYMNKEISNFLIKLTNKVSNDDEKKIGAYFHVINDIERIGDHAYNFYDAAKKLDEKDLKFSPTAVKELKQMYDCIEQMFVLAKEIFQTKNKKELAELHNIEDETDKLKTVLSDAHYDRITKNQCTMELSPFYSTMVSELERVADHLVNIGYSIINPVGDDENIILEGK